MRYVLPFFVTPLVRSFEVRAGRALGIGVASGWRLDGSPVHVSDLWRELGEELSEGVPLDQGIPKSRGELVVSGVAYPGQLAEATHVRVQVGPIDKTLYVVGDRVWQDGVASRPAPFQGMRLGWERAFGGRDVPSNPVGRGTDGVELPNIERPGRLISSPSERPEPAGLGAIDVSWPQRMRFAGTYDETWLRTRYPGFADDTDWRFFQVAPEDQWLEAMWRGDEPVVAENLHPERPKCEGRLPGVLARAFVQRQGSVGLAEVPMRLTTVWLVPHRSLVVLVHHGSAETAEADASDVERLVVGMERLGEQRPPAHYQEVTRRRMDPEWGPLHSLRNEDLMPEGMVLPQLGDDAALPLRDGRIEENVKRRTMASQQKLRDALKDARVEASELDGDPSAAPSITDPRELPQRIEDVLRTAKQERDASKQRVAKVIEDLGRAPSKALPGGPPLLVGSMLRGRLEGLIREGKRLGKPVAPFEAQLADPRFRERLEFQDRVAREAYRQTAHRRPAAREREETEAQRLRAIVVEASRGRGSLDGLDLTGADLSHLDLRGAPLTGAWLEGANLQCADLRGAVLRNAVLTRADLSDAKLGGTQMSGANLGHARMLWVRAEGTVDLTGAILHKADLRGASLPDSNLHGADLSEAHFEQTDLSQVNAAGITLIKGSLVGAKLAHANLSNASLLEVDLRGVDFSGVGLEKATLYACNAEGADFRGARLSNLRAVGACVLDGVDFRGADLTGANLRGLSMVGAAFGGAMLDGADLSEAKAARAVFYRASAKGARFVKTDLSEAQLVSVNLMNALLTEAVIRGADLRGANLFAADLWDAQGDAGMRLEGALTTRARFRRELTA